LGYLSSSSPLAPPLVEALVAKTLSCPSRFTPDDGAQVAYSLVGAAVTNLFLPLISPLVCAPLNNLTHSLNPSTFKLSASPSFPYGPKGPLPRFRRSGGEVVRPSDSSFLVMLSFVFFSRQVQASVFCVTLIPVRFRLGWYWPSGGARGLSPVYEAGITIQAAASVSPNSFPSRGGCFFSR